MDESIAVTLPPPAEQGFNMGYMELLTGPLSALALAIIMIYTIGRWLAKFVPTVVAKYMEQTDKTIEQLDKLNQSMQAHNAKVNDQTDQIIEKVRSTSAGLHARLNTIEPVIIKIEANQSKSPPDQL
jgi:ABC-type Zn uptake system ZnuABC Zn-binding protein ZnuA